MLVLIMPSEGWEDRARAATRRMAAAFCSSGRGHICTSIDRHADITMLKKHNILVEESEQSTGLGVMTQLILFARHSRTRSFMWLPGDGGTVHILVGQGSPADVTRAAHGT